MYRPLWLGLIVIGCMVLAVTVYGLLSAVQDQYASRYIAFFGIFGVLALLGGLIYGYYVDWDMQGYGGGPDEPSNVITPEDEGKDW